jgi:hypothetical protein
LSIGGGIFNSGAVPLASGSAYLVHTSVGRGRGIRFWW